MKIVVDAAETPSGLPVELGRLGCEVEVRRLPAGDVAIGQRILVERKTVDDFRASLDDGRLFKQAWAISTTAPRPVLMIEGDLAGLERRMTRVALRGVLLTLTVGYRIPILVSRDTPGTAACLRHMALQEDRRLARFQERYPPRRAPPPRQPSAEAFEALLALPGVGEFRARAIAARVGSLAELCRLGVRDLMDIPGIGPDTAARIVDSLRGRLTT